MNKILSAINFFLLLIILNQLNKMATDLTALTAAVARDTEVDESAITLLKGNGM